MDATLERLGEFGLIDLFARASAPRHPATRVGIGDDCAVLDLGGPERLLLTTDMLIERVHFERDWMSAEELGHKSMAVNLSDVAAMGGEAVAALLALGLPPGLGVAWVEGFRDGLCACARRHGVDLVGGDTVAAPAAAVLCLTVVGRAPADEVVLRAGGRAGDRLLVCGPLGDSAAGLHLLRGGGEGLSAEDRAALLAAHRRPEPQLALGRELARRRLVHAMIDVSDGLLQDLGHICERSGLGAELDADAVPLSEAARRLAALERRDACAWALGGGEDYRLLFSVPAERVAEAGELCRGLGLQPAELGALVAGSGVRARRGGRPYAPLECGYDAFRRGGGP